MSVSKPIFTVIIPAYNSERYIVRAIESARNQKCQELEVIVVDDGSEDDTLYVANSAIHHYQLTGMVTSRPPDLFKGAGASRNYGASLARGEFLAFLDSDDIWNPDHLENALLHFNQNGDEMGAYCAMATLFDDSGQRGIMPENGFPCIGLQDALPFLLKQMFLPNQTLCVRRSLFIETTGFSDSLSCYEDWWLALQLAKKKKFYFNPISECMIRVRSDSLSRTVGHKGKGLRMSSAMFRDQLVLHWIAKRSGIFNQSELSVLIDSVIRFHRAHLGDMIRARRFYELVRIVKALAAAKPKGLEFWPAIWGGALLDASSHAMKKAVRHLKRPKIF